MKVETNPLDFAVEYFACGALIFFPAEARMVRVNDTAAALLRGLLAGQSDSALCAELQDVHGLLPEEAGEMVAFLREQLAVFGLNWHAAEPQASVRGVVEGS